MRKKRNSLDIFQVLGEMTAGNIGFYESLPEEKQKAFSPVVAMQWARGADTHREYRVLMMNLSINRFLFTIGYKHPDLMYKMLALSNGFSDGARYQYIKKGKQSKYPKTVKLLQRVYCINPTHAQEALPMLDKESVVEIAENVGCDDQEVRDLKKEWK